MNDQENIDQQLKDFDLRTLPKPEKKAVVPSSVEKQDNYRIQSDDRVCIEEQDTNRILNGRSGEDAKREMSRLLKICIPDDTSEMNFYDDGTTTFGPKGMGKLRITREF